MYTIDSKKRFSLVFYEGCPPHDVEPSFFTERNGYDDNLLREIDQVEIGDWMRIHCCATTLFRDDDFTDIGDV